MRKHDSKTRTDTTLMWDGPQGGELVAPPLTEVRRRIEDLNGHDRTLVTITRGSDHLVVGGSSAHGLVVYIQVGEGREFWEALSSVTSSDESVTVVAGVSRVTTQPDWSQRSKSRSPRQSHSRYRASVQARCSGR